LNDELTIHHLDNLDEVVYTESREDETDTTGTTATQTTTDGQATITTSTTSTNEEVTEGETGTDDTETTVATENETKTLQFEGPSARVLRSQAESRVNGDTDTVSSIDVSFDVDGLTKEELIELIEQLPGVDHIEATVVIEREIQD
jgi:hypothetical protein